MSITVPAADLYGLGYTKRGLLSRPLFYIKVEFSVVYGFAILYTVFIGKGRFFPEKALFERGHP